MERLRRWWFVAAPVLIALGAFVFWTLMRDETNAKAALAESRAADKIKRVKKRQKRIAKLEASAGEHAEEIEALRAENAGDLAVVKEGYQDAGLGADDIVARFSRIRLPDADAGAGDGAA